MPFSQPMPSSPAKPQRRIPWRMLLLLVALGALGWWYYRGNVCDLPLEYRIGEIDSRFELTRDELASAAAEAEALWEKPAGRDLLLRDDGAEYAVSVNMIYDERQLATQELARLDDARTGLEGELSDISGEYAVLRETFDRQEKLIDELSATYETRLENFERTVESWNARGGAPADVYDQLTGERQQLNEYVDGLNALIAKQKDLAARINALAAQESERVSGFNAEVRKFNKDFVEQEQDTEQGIYGYGTINLYQFDSHEDLVMLLAHEMGHALGLNHTPNDPTSLMYPTKNDRQRDGKVNITRASLGELGEKCNF